MELSVRSAASAGAVAAVSLPAAVSAAAAVVASVPAVCAGAAAFVAAAGAVVVSVAVVAVFVPHAAMEKIIVPAIRSAMILFFIFFPLLCLR
jgi:hypothetical protein